MRVLGIDTSNYTTSVALYDGDRFIMQRKILDVKQGMRGIRQSEGVFIHNKELPAMLKEILDDVKIDAVGVSTAPRSIAGSYMPVFTVGHGYATAIASALGVNLYEFSHQDGHIMAGVYSADAKTLLDAPFISLHLSGGTTEVLKTTFNGCSFVNEIIGGTLDISAGQLVDRVGVKMGLKFPCGKELEKLALTTDKTQKLPFSVNNGYVNLSGIETKLLNSISGPDPLIARTVFEYLKDVIIKLIENAMDTTGISDVLIVGGVASNSIIRNGLLHRFGKSVRFATAELSSDNAVGTAVLAYMAEEKK